MQDVLLEIEQSVLDAQAWFETDYGMGEVLFHRGQMVRARLGGARGQTALLRLLAIREGTYGIEVRSVIKQPAIIQNVSRLIALYRTRQVEWNDLCSSAPPLSSVLRLTSSGADVRDSSRGIQRVILVLLDGHRTLMQVLEESSFDPVEALKVVTQAMTDGLLQVVQQTTSLFPLASAGEASGVLPRMTASTPAMRIEPANADSGPFSSRKSTLVGLGINRTLSKKSSSSLAPAPIIDIGADSAPRSEGYSFGAISSLSGEYPADGFGPKANGQRRYVNRYEILLRIGRGGMGTVYLARLSTGSVGFSRLYAVKLMRSQLSVDTQAAKDFLEEASIAGNLHHANIVPVYDAGFHGKQPYLVMEYVEGCSFNQLTQYITNRSPYFILPIVIDSLAGLQAAHVLRDEMGDDLKLVHCDISPENILVGVDGTCRLTDFGMARKANRLLGSTTRGKAGYIAPEHVAGQTFDHRADIFSMGVVLWNALTGTSLFAAETIEETLAQVCNKLIVPPSSLGAQSSPALDDIVMRALARDPSDRFESAEEMLTALSRVAADQAGLATPKEIASWVREVAGTELTQRRLAILDASRNNPTIPPPAVEASPVAIPTVNSVEVEGQTHDSQTRESRSDSVPPVPRIPAEDAGTRDQLRTHDGAVSSSDAPPRSESEISSIFYGEDRYALKQAKVSPPINAAPVSSGNRQPQKRHFQVLKPWTMVALLALAIVSVILTLMKMRQH